MQQQELMVPSVCARLRRNLTMASRAFYWSAQETAQLDKCG